MVPPCSPSRWSPGWAASLHIPASFPSGSNQALRVVGSCSFFNKKPLKNFQGPTLPLWKSWAVLRRFWGYSRRNSGGRRERRLGRWRLEERRAGRKVRARLSPEGRVLGLWRLGEAAKGPRGPQQSVSGSAQRAARFPFISLVPPVSG